MLLMNNVFDFESASVLGGTPMFYAAAKDRKDERAVKREYDKCHASLVALEYGFLREVFLIEELDAQYDELYKHYLKHWVAECNKLERILKHIKIDRRYFANCYKPVEVLNDL